MTGEPILATSGAAKLYATRSGASHPAFGPVDLAVYPGECVGLIGRSGAGKSTLARCLAGLEPLSQGELRSPAGLPRRAVQLIFQDSPAALNPAWTVAAILEEPLRLAGVAAHVGPLLTQVGLAEGLLGRRPRELSGGERRRVAIARALAVPELRVLILDEPFAGLDADAAQAIAALLSELRTRRQLALLLITHDLAAVRRLAGRLYVMAAGRFVEQLPAAELAAARHPESRLLIEAMLPGEAA